MGSSWSKLKRAIEKGEESRALELYSKSSDIRRKLNANSVINEYTLDTYMHVSARHGMHEFLKLLLYENRGNPNKLNRRKQTVLHKVCEGNVDAVQYECMQLLLQWHDPTASASQLMLAAGANKSSSPQQPTSPSRLPNNTSQQSPPPQNLAHNSLLVDINVNAKDDVRIFIIEYNRNLISHLRSLMTHFVLHIFKADNTPLHYAAMKNLATCVQVASWFTF